MILYYLCQRQSTKTKNKMKIKGKITESSTGNPVPYVNVYLSTNGGQITEHNIGTQTNDNGEYETPEMPVESGYITASSVGYEMVTANFNKSSKTLNFIFEPSVATLGGIEITATPLKPASEAKPKKGLGWEVIAIVGGIALSIFGLTAKTK